MLPAVSFIACVTREDVCASGCSFGSLAAEIMKSDLAVHDEVTAGVRTLAGLVRAGAWPDVRARGTAP
jgi:hypothetical protein